MEAETQQPEWLVRAEAVRAAMQRISHRIHQMSMEELEQKRKAIKRDDIESALSHGERSMAFFEAGREVRKFLNGGGW